MYGVLRCRCKAVAWRTSPVHCPPKDPKIVSASYVLINDSIPQDRTFSLEDLNGYFTKEGLHTIEILHQTPFGTDLLFSSMINVDRTVQVTGTVFSKE